VYQGDQRVAGYDTAIGNIGLHVGSPFGRYGGIRMGVGDPLVPGSIDSWLRSAAVFCRRRYASRADLSGLWIWQ
jgi:hypothetical protein